ncbi:MAG: hypothetical protein DMF60_00390 [Acidobacteria bacterium]|nr:MAG: hypothetical protein DMF60_00390 [Acidobacteriota bacterium]
MKAFSSRPLAIKLFCISVIPIAYLAFLGFPWLLAAVGKPSVRFYVTIISRSDPIRDRVTVEYAIRDLCRLGPEAKNAAPALKILLQNKELMECKNAESAYEAAETIEMILLALGKTGREAKEAIPEILRAANHPIPDVREHALIALGGIGLSTPEVLATLTKALKGKDESYRENCVCAYAAWALGKLGPEAKAAVPALIEVSKDMGHGKYLLAQDARRALSKIGTPEALAAANPNLGDGYPEDLLQLMKPAPVSRSLWESPPFWVRDP